MRHRLDTFFQNQYRYGGFEGVVLAAYGRDTFFSACYGMADRAAGRPFRLGDAFQLASASKPITALALMQLVEKGQLGLEDTVRHILPEFPYPDITVRMLLSHRSGLPNYMYLSDDWWRRPGEAMRLPELRRLFADLQPRPYYSPGQRFDYNNSNYALLAAIVAERSGQAFEGYLAAHIFAPAGMADAFVVSDSVFSGHPGVPSYRAGGDKVQPSYLDGVPGDKGVYASALDLCRLSAALAEGRIVQPGSLAAMQQPQHSDFPDMFLNYGLGWRLYQAPTGRFFAFHTGWWMGFRSLWLREPATGFCLVALCNNTNGGIDPQAAAALLDAVPPYATAGQD